MAKADVHTTAYDRQRHRPGSKGANGLCSWTENCPNPPSFTTIAEYSDSGRRYTWALCDAHQRRVTEFFGE